MKRSTKPPTASDLLGAAWRPVRRRDRLCQMAGPCRRLGLWHGAQLNDMLFKVRRRLGLPYWSLSALLKHKVKNAVEYISRFEEIVAREAEMRGVDGVVCGHIHHAEIRRIGGVLYLNDGDWVESCSALVEDAQGKYGDSSLGRSLLRDSRRSRRAELRLWLPDTPRPRLYPRRSSRLEPGPHPRRGGPFENPDRHRCLDTPGQWRGAHAGDAWQGSWERSAIRVRYITPLGRLTFPLPTYPEIRLALFPAQSTDTRDPGIRARRRAYRHRRYAGALGAAHLHQARHRLLHVLPHPFSRICACALSAWCRKS